MLEDLRLNRLNMHQPLNATASDERGTRNAERASRDWLMFEFLEMNFRCRPTRSFCVSCARPGAMRKMHVFGQVGLHRGLNRATAAAAAVPLSKSAMQVRTHRTVNGSPKGRLHSQCYTPAPLHKDRRQAAIKLDSKT